MGAYTTIRGWMQIEESMKDSVIGIIKSYNEKGNEYSISQEIAELYNGGWHIQSGNINGAIFIFYGATVRTHSIDFIKSQAETIARLKEETEDYTLYPEGYFHIDEDGTHGLPPEEWIAMDGELTAIKRRKI